MKAIISSTFDDTYLFYLPITTWLWNKLDVGVICFMPTPIQEEWLKLNTVQKYSNAQLHFFDAPEHKKATYAQCSRLYAAALNLPDDEILITSDIDMAVFSVPKYSSGGLFTIFGKDLVPEKQYPMCYISASAELWRKAFNPNNKSIQDCLDELLGNIECENMRGNYWCLDQEKAYNVISKDDFKISIPRAIPGTQFASNRIDRDDIFFMDRLSPEIIDYHMHRPCYTDENFSKILSVIRYFYPNDDLSWMERYRQQYKKLVENGNN